MLLSGSNVGALMKLESMAWVRNIRTDSVSRSGHNWNTTSSKHYADPWHRSRVQGMGFTVYGSRVSGLGCGWKDKGLREHPFFLHPVGEGVGLSLCVRKNSRQFPQASTPALNSKMCRVSADLNPLLYCAILSYNML